MHLDADPVEWAVGTCGTTSLAWTNPTEFIRTFYYPVYSNLPGTDTCLHLINSDRYFDVHWARWSCCEAGGFAYTRREWFGGSGHRP